MANKKFKVEDVKFVDKFMVHRNENYFGIYDTLDECRDAIVNDIMEYSGWYDYPNANVMARKLEDYRVTAIKVPVIF